MGTQHSTKLGQKQASLTKGDFKVKIYLDLPTFITKIRVTGNEQEREFSSLDPPQDRRKSHLEESIKLVDDEDMNEALLDSTLEDVERVADGIMQDLDKKADYFEISMNSKEKSEDLLNKVQKYVYMLELYQIRRYHQNSKFSSGSDSDEEPPEPSKFDKINSEFSSVVDGSLGNSEEITIRKIIEGSSYKNFSKLHCKVIGLKTCQSMDGVDFLLNKRDVKVKYLNDGDELEILWLDLDNKATKRSFTHNYNRCEIIKTIGKGGFSLVYLIRNYKITKKNRVGFGRGRILKKEDSEKYADPDFNKFSTAIEATPFAKSQNSYTFNQNSTDIYALKSMSKAMISQFKQADHVMNEKEIMNSLDHPFIIKMHYSFSTKNYLNLVLDYWPGGELFFHISKQKRFTEAVARFYIAEVILAIEHLHDNNIIYRDLKPENVLIDYDGHIKLTDFGLSEMNFTKDSTSNIFCGSPEYMAPEMILKYDYTRMIDIFAIGVLLYEMIAGIPTFFSQKRSDLFYNIVNNQPKFSKHFSSKAKDFIRKLLRKDYIQRLGYQNGMSDVKSHPFFDGFDWDKLYNKVYTPPYQPSAREIYFSSEFTSIPVELNFEEEVLHKRSRMSEVEKKNVPIQSLLNKEASTFGEYVAPVVDDFSDDLSEPPAPKRKSSEPPSCKNFNTRMVVEKRDKKQAEKKPLKSEQESMNDKTPTNNQRKISAFGDYVLHNNNTSGVKNLEQIGPNEKAPTVTSIKLKKPGETTPETSESPQTEEQTAKFGSSMKKKLKSFPTQNFNITNNQVQKCGEKYDIKSYKRSESVMNLKLDHLMTNNIVSERHRIDPRELDSPRDKSSEETSEEFDLSWSEEDEEEEQKQSKGYTRIETIQELEREDTLGYLDSNPKKNFLFSTNSEIADFSIDENDGFVQRIPSYPIRKSIVTEKSQIMTGWGKPLLMRDKSKTGPVNYSSRAKWEPQNTSNIEFDYKEIGDDELLYLFNETTTEGNEEGNTKSIANAIKRSSVKMWTPKSLNKNIFYPRPIEPLKITKNTASKGLKSQLPLHLAKEISDANQDANFESFIECNGSVNNSISEELKVTDKVPQSAQKKSENPFLSCDIENLEDSKSTEKKSGMSINEEEKHLRTEVEKHWNHRLDLSLNDSITPPEGASKVNTQSTPQNYFRRIHTCSKVGASNEEDNLDNSLEVSNQLRTNSLRGFLTSEHNAPYRNHFEGLKNPFSDAPNSTRLRSCYSKKAPASGVQSAMPLGVSRFKGRKMHPSWKRQSDNIISKKTRIKFKVSQETVKMQRNNEISTQKFDISGRQSWTETYRSERSHKSSTHCKRPSKGKDMHYYTEKFIKNILGSKKDD